MMGMDEWLEFFRRAKKSIGILVHAGGFLAENNRFLRLMRERAAKDVSVRILLGDPESPEILTRGLEERLGRGVEFKVRNAIVAYSPLMGVPGISFRIHRSTLHNSIYRADEEWLINTHIYGISAPHAPMLHLRRVPGAGLVNSYERSFEMVWDSSAELEEGALSQ